jgi:HEAT repeat protein
MKQLIVVIGSVVSLAVACLAQAPWRTEHHDSLLVAPGATDVRYVNWSTGPDELIYTVREAFPASAFRQSICDQLERKGWKSLTHSACGTEWMTPGPGAYRWQGAWTDENGHNVEYMLDYASGDLKHLRVQATYSPGKLARNSRQRISSQPIPSLTHLSAEYRLTDNVIQQIANLKNPDTAIRQNAADALGKFKDPRGIEPLIAALTDKDGEVRASAARALGVLHDRRATVPLIALLKDKDRDVQMSVSAALGDLKDPAAVAPLIAAMNDKSLGDGRFATIALGKIGAPAVETLIALLGNKDASVRRSAADALAGSCMVGKASDSRCVPPLIAAMRDPDSNVREAAAAALAVTGDPRAIDPLIAALKDANTEVRSVVANCLGAVSDSRAIAALTTALHDPDPVVRQSAAQALGGTRDSKATDSLIAALNDTNVEVRTLVVEELGPSKDPRAVEPLMTALRDPDPVVRHMAAEALGKLKDPRAIELLIAVLNENSFAAQALGEIKDPRAVGPLTAALRSAKKNQVLYLSALGTIGSPAVDSLISTLKDKDTEVRKAAIEALGKTKDPRAVDVLIATLSDTNSLIRASAISALGAAGDARAVGPLIKSLREEPVVWEREFVAIALSDIALPAVDPLIAVLKDPDGHTRMLAAEALDQIVGKFKNQSAVRALMTALEQRNTAAIAGAYRFFVDRGEPGSQRALIEALDQFGSERMAAYLLNCGDVQLEAAARAWAKAHAPGMHQQVYGVWWGSAREMQPSIQIQR